MHAQRKAIVSCSAAGILSSFLPWVHAPLVGAVVGVSGADGWIALILFVPALVIGLVGDKSVPVTGGKLYGAFIPALLGSGVGLWKLGELSRLSGEMSDNAFGRALAQSISAGIGLYLLIASGVAMTVLARVLKKGSAESGGEAPGA